MQIKRIWAMPNKWTFTIKPIKELIKLTMFENPGIWIDPFSGMHSPAKYKNDLNPNCNAQFNFEAIDFLKMFKNGSITGCFFDPPYSFTRAIQLYKGIGKNFTHGKTCMNFYSEAKNEMARVIKVGGLALCFGWSSMGLGKNRGFNLESVLLVPHGGTRNDTIVTVERKTQKKSLTFIL